MTLNHALNNLTAFALFAAALTAFAKAIRRDLHTGAFWRANPASRGCWTFAALCSGLASAIEQHWIFGAPCLLLGFWELWEGKP